MSSINTESMSTIRRTRTYQGAPARIPETLKELRKAVLSSFLWESTYYESGGHLAERIGHLIKQTETQDLIDLAIEARHDMNLRHIPLFIAAEMVRLDKHKGAVRKIIPEIVNRPDDLTELLALYWRLGKAKIPMQLKRGIADALSKFSAYQLSKYKNSQGIKLYDLFNLTHPKPKSKEQAKIWKDFLSGKLKQADTWERKLSSEGNTKESWENLLSERRLGAMALLRNLRNMHQCGVNPSLIESSLLEANYARVLPFRFIAAAKYAPHLEPAIERAFISRLGQLPRLSGRTAVLVDVSGSMSCVLSVKSDMDRIDAGCGLAMIVRELCEDFHCYAFHTELFAIAPRHGFALRDAIRSVGSGGTYLGAAIRTVEREVSNLDRIIVFTDEQSHDSVPQPLTEKAYMINVASYRPEVSYGKWISISGFSERVVDFISMIETL